jgi:hypothetical protein
VRQLEQTPHPRGNVGVELKEPSGVVHRLEKDV